MANSKKSTTKAARSSSTRATKGRTAKVTKKAPGRTRRVKAAAPAPVVVAANGKSYPFPSKREIIAQIDSDAGHAIAALVQIHKLDAAMCSQKKAVSDLAAEIEAAGNGAAKDESLVNRSRAVARRYGRRLAQAQRAKILESNPELRPVAELFTAGNV